jgi:mRNA interferase MazF
MANSVRRQDVWLVNLNPPGKGREIHKTRPALVVSHDDFNNSPADLVIVLPITSTDLKIPAHIRIDPPEGGVRNASFIKCDQIRTISKERLIKRWGSVSGKTMSAVEDAIRILLDL